MPAAEGIGHESRHRVERGADYVVVVDESDASANLTGWVTLTIRTSPW